MLVVVNFLVIIKSTYYTYSKKFLIDIIVGKIFILPLLHGL